MERIRVDYEKILTQDDTNNYMNIGGVKELKDKYLSEVLQTSQPNLQVRDEELQKRKIDFFNDRIKLSEEA